jgi:hypothetical protein
MTEVAFSFTEPQAAMHNSPARFKVCAAGRRLGKTTFAIMECILEALATHNHYGDPVQRGSEVVYIGIDREQAKRNAWQMLKDLARPFTVKVHENNCTVVVNNGVMDCTIRLMGMDRPDAARGMKLRYAVLDEYADMPEDVWGEIVRPALMDCRGCALFIGTPKGKNHFYQLHAKALVGEAGPEWEAFHFMSEDNSTLNRDELKQMAVDYAKGSPELFAQEIEGKFISKGGALFHTDDFIIDSTEPDKGSWFITVDLAGFERDGTKKNAQIKRLDETAICICKAYPSVNKDGKEITGWWVKEIQHGRWGVEETAKRIVDAYQEVQAVAVGIERGALKNAVTPYMDAYMRQRAIYFEPQPLTHGNQRKYDRVQWALQGRVLKGGVTLNEGAWNEVLLEQAVDFPSRLTHDDLLDALAYQDQIADYFDFDLSSQQNLWEAIDPISGY